MPRRRCPSLAAAAAAASLAVLLPSATASLSSRGVSGDGCLPADVVAMLKGEITDAVAFGCRKEIQEGTSCSTDCHDAIVGFQEVRASPGLCQCLTLTAQSCSGHGGHARRHALSPTLPRSPGTLLRVPLAVAAPPAAHAGAPPRRQPMWSPPPQWRHRRPAALARLPPWRAPPSLRRRLSSDPLPPPPQRAQSNTLVSLQGVWFGIYPASGIELVELRLDASNGMLSGTKLTGNQFVRAGRVSFEITQSSCRVVSSMWAGAFTPRWDPCRLAIYDSDHMSVTLSLGEGEEEELNFVRARLPLLLDWDDPNSPTYGFSDAMRRCNMEPEDSPSSILSELWASLHHSKNTVLLDQGLLLFPLVLLGGYQMGGASTPMAILGAAAYCVLLCARLRYTGLMS